MRQNAPPPPGEWADHAACIGHRADFFPPENASKADRAEATARAVAICSTCPVIGPCGGYAYTNELFADHDGIYGGETAQTRRNKHARSKAARRRSAASKPKTFRPDRLETDQRKRIEPPTCGTYAAWTWHRKHGEPIDEACRLAHNAYNRSNGRITAA